MLFSMLVAFGTLAVLLIDTIITGWPAHRVEALHRPDPSTRSGGGGRKARDPRDALPRACIVLLLSVPIGVLTAIYLEEYADRTRWWNRLIEVNIQNLAAVPSIVYGILGLAFIVRGIGIGRVVFAGGAHPHARRPPDGHRGVSRGDPGGAGLDPPGRVRARRDEVAGRLAAGAARFDPGHRHGVDPRPLARRGRDGAAAHGRRDGVRRVRSRAPRRVHRDARADLQLDAAVRSRSSRRSPPPARSCCSSSCSA